MSRAIILSLFIAFFCTGFAQEKKHWKILEVLHFYPPSHCARQPFFLTDLADCQEGDYYLTFEDNFDGNNLDLDEKWELPWQGEMNDFDHERSKCWLANHGSSPSIPYTHNIEVSNGTLKLIARHEDPPIVGTVSGDGGVLDTDNYDYSSAWIQTQQEFSYGKFEARCRLPAGKGFWPAFWVYGGQKWSEIDFFEIHDEDMNDYTCNIWRDYDNNPLTPHDCPYNNNNYADFTDWHTFTVYYERDRITWCVDNNAIRTVYRYVNDVGEYVLCSDDIANGTYYELKAFPIESMKMILNLSVQDGSNAPNENTVFPANYEVDYVRYWRKMKEECDGCIDHVSYQNTNHLPPVTRASTYIESNNNVSVENGQNVKFRSPVIELSSGFNTEIGGIYEGIVQECNLLNYEDMLPNLDGTNAYEGVTIIKCDNPVYTIDVSGATIYSITITDANGQVVQNTTGTVYENFIDVWNAVNAASGWYSVHLVLTNCTTDYANDYNIYVLEGDCKDFSGGENGDKGSSLTSDSSEATDQIFTVFPNPVDASLNLVYTANSNSSVKLSIKDIYGREIWNDSRPYNTGINSDVINVGQFSNGAYVLTVTQQGVKKESKFVISR